MGNHGIRCEACSGRTYKMRYFYTKDGKNTSRSIGGYRYCPTCDEIMEVSLCPI